ncbi:hypothetical protein QAD02_007301 [Eretmocerus hayati]|uniref:Uncharacterized protein n=1 Tax=Eretmocerus hayati TaxID=131215 RepID=A0ACC2N3K2_9HYME|nr:hypothetical protein QAD02_007301 [Eretmocerus hayati]
MKIPEISQVLPDFDGKGISVNRFIRECLDIKPFVNPQERAFFLRLVKSRVEGSASSYLQYKTFDDLDQLLDELRRTFASSQNLPQVQAELARVVQIPGERGTDYGLRVTSLLHKINELANEKFGREVAQNMVEGSISAPTTLNTNRDDLSVPEGSNKPRTNPRIIDRKTLKTKIKVIPITTDTTHCIPNQPDTTYCISNGPRPLESPPNRVDTGLEVRDRRQNGTTNCTQNGPRPLESPPNRVDTGLEVRDRRRNEPSTAANQSDNCSHSPWEATDRDDGPKEDIDCTTNGPQTLESPPICVDTGSSRCVTVAPNPPWATTETCGRGPDEGCPQGLGWSTASRSTTETCGPRTGMDPEVGDVVKSELESGRLILFAFIKEKYDDIPSVSTVCLCLTHLRDALLNDRIGTVSLAKRGGGLDDIPWAPIEDTIRTHWNVENL